MRRFLSLIATAAMLLALASCHRAELSKPLMVILVPSQDNPYFKAEADAAAARAISLGYRVRLDAHNDDAYRQDNLIDAAIASNASAIILDNAGADSSIAAIRRATKAGIPCFLIDREIEATGIAKAQIIADNNQGARIVAEEFVRAIGTQGGEYAELLGRESDTNAQVRTAGIPLRAQSISLVQARRGAVSQLVSIRGISKDGDHAAGTCRHSWHHLLVTTRWRSAPWPR